MSSRCIDEEQTVPLESITEKFASRVRGLDKAHVELLAELAGDWPPILVQRESFEVIDGHHRVAAARLCKITHVRVEWFDGSAEQAYIESIRRNTSSGLPLTLAERVAAATNVLAREPEWSDRRVAVLCGISASTVARIRTETSAAVTSKRLGRDGRLRPARPGDARRRVLSALAENPHGSLRSIASLAAVSPETVRTIKRRLEEGDSRDALRDPPASLGSVHGEGALADGLGAFASRVSMLSSDSDVALVSCESGGGMVGWLSNGTAVYEWPNLVAGVPLSRVYEIADEARRRAAAWMCFADALEPRAYGRRAVAS